jgi:nitroreductase
MALRAGDVAESGSPMDTFDDVVRARRSVRGFVRNRPVPQAVLLDALALARLAPSNCNVQPWRVYLASGNACERLRAALTAAVDAGEAPAPEDPIDTFVGDDRRRQIECARTLYGAMGIAREDAAGRARAMRRNYELFDAPHVAIVCMDAAFGVGVALDIGIYVQTLMLALTARGIASCPQASLRNYPAVVRRVLEIPNGLRILCGISIGYEDPAVAANRAQLPRESLEDSVVLRND